MILIVLQTFWVVALIIFAACALYPVGTKATRLIGLASFAFLWLGLAVFFWKYRWLRWIVPAVTVAVGIFLVLPGRPASQESLREKYVGCLKRYEGVLYVWGGENAVGIDCSGLIRRGLMDALFLEGMKTFNPGLVRESIALWWFDTTARVLGEATGPTTAVTELPKLSPEPPSINLLDHSKIQPGDLAVTTSGIHVLAYLGDQIWIEADPGVGRVVTAKAPSRDNPWLSAPVNIVRWKLLQP
jgi:hypothetical protein